MSSPRTIFISYRRSDCRNITRKIYDLLAKQFGHQSVFRDLDAIPAGETFKEYIARELSQCQLLIAVIGPKWLEITDRAYKGRLNNPNDWVRLEIEWALKRKIPVIPLLINDTKMPPANALPGPLKALTTRHAARMSHTFWLNRRNVNRLIDEVNQYLLKASKTPSLVPFFFEVVTVDEQGKKSSRQQKTAKCIRENLGNGVILDMVMIPGSQFQMGSPAIEGNDHERPWHPVTVESLAVNSRWALQQLREMIMSVPGIQ